MRQNTMRNVQNAEASRGRARAIHFLTFSSFTGASFACFVLLISVMLTNRWFLIASVFGGAVGTLLGVLFGRRQRERISSELLGDRISFEGTQRNILLTLVEFGPFSMSVLYAQVTMIGGGLTDLASFILLGTFVHLACLVASKSLMIVTRLRTIESYSSGKVWINATRKGPIFELTTQPEVPKAGL